jgi:hypothetical protein
MQFSRLHRVHTSLVATCPTGIIWQTRPGTLRVNCIRQYISDMDDRYEPGPDECESSDIKSIR